MGSKRGTQEESAMLFSCSVLSSSLQPHGLQHARPPCPSLSPSVCSNSCPSSRWCHPTISSSVVPFSSCLQSFPESGSFPMSCLAQSSFLMWVPLNGMDETKAPLSLHLPYFSRAHFSPHPMPTSCQNFWLPSWCTLPCLHLLGSRGLDVSSLSWRSPCWQPSCSDTSRRSSSSLRPGLPLCLPGIRGYLSCWFSTLQVRNLQGGWGLTWGYTRAHWGPERWLTSLVTAISPWSWRISSPFSPLMVGVKNP